MSPTELLKKITLSTITIDNFFCDLIKEFWVFTFHNSLPFFKEKHLSVLSKSIIKNRNLSIEMAKQELRDKYVGQVFGKYWVFIHPIFLTGMYLFVFGVVYRQRIGGTYEMPLDFTSYILSGLVSWFFIMDALSKSCTIITINKTLIKQILFPLEILPLKSLLASLLPQLVTLLILIIYVLISNGSLVTGTPTSEVFEIH